MCGIIGYYGEESSKILEGLKNLEYRGYDSWGVAIKNEKIELIKEIGKIKEVSLPKGFGIGHTRWATHGTVTTRNAHPHHDEKKRFFVVHNGIIENYKDIKVHEKLYSETDSEIIPKLLAKYAEKGFFEAVKCTCQELRGNYAFLAIDRESDYIIAVRNNSPLIIGTGPENFVASDVTAFVKYTKEIIFMEDEEIAKIGNNVEIYDFDGNIKNKETTTIDWDIEEVMKGNNKHFMLKEIKEQPQVLKRTIESELVKVKKPKRIIIVACGTSWHAGLIAEYWFEKIAKIPVEVEYASEFRYRDPIIEEETAVIAISQSGETADTLAAIKESQRKGAKVISICNVYGSTIDRMSDVKLYTRAGPEIGVASTKAFITQIGVLLKLVLSFTNDTEITQELEKIPDNIEETLSIDFGPITETYHQKKNALFLGRGVNFPVALEGALKLKEISYIHAEGYPAAEMKHGPIALIDKDMPSIFICVKDESYDKVLSNIQEVKAREGKVIVIGTENDTKLGEYADHIIHIPDTHHMLTPFLTTIPMQLISYHIADKKGKDIDKPRNLAKSVTVE